MSLQDRLINTERARLFIALLALLASLAGVFTLPVLDRDEARFAQASAQMVESGDIVDIRFQDQPRHKKPIGIYWLQSLTVAVTTGPEAREIWTYRLPSVLGAALAAELGYATWDACKRDIDRRPPEVLDRFRLDLGALGDHEHIWFADQPTAAAWQREHGGRMVEYGKQAVVMPA